MSRALDKADVIYVTGGNTYYLLERSKKSGFLDVVKNKISSGAFYFGCSAGAVLSSPRIDFIEDMDDPSLGDIDGYSALSLTDFLILPHLDHEKYGPKARAIASKLKSKDEKIMGLRDDQGVYIEDNFVQIF